MFRIYTLYAVSFLFCFHNALDAKRPIKRSCADTDELESKFARISENREPIQESTKLLAGFLDGLSTPPPREDFEGQAVEQYLPKLQVLQKSTQLTLSLLQADPDTSLKPLVDKVFSLPLQQLVLTGPVNSTELSASSFCAFVRNILDTNKTLPSLKDIRFALHLYRDDAEGEENKLSWMPSSGLPTSTDRLYLKSKFPALYKVIDDYFQEIYLDEGRENNYAAKWSSVIIAYFLQHFPQLERLTFNTFDFPSDIIASTLTATIKSNKLLSLTHLDLSHSRWIYGSAAAQQETASSFFSIVFTTWKNTLQWLDLSCSELIELMDAHVLRDIQNPEDILSSTTTEESAEENDEIQSTTTCHLKHLFIGIEHTEDTKDGYSAFPEIKESDLCYAHEMPALCWLTFLKHVPRLETLDITNHRWTDACIENVQDGLSNLQDLKKLYFHGHCLSPDTKNSFKRSITENLPHIQTVDDYASYLWCIPSTIT